MKTALVLGAGGFIGSHLVKRLKEEGYWVRGVDIKRPEFWDSFADQFLLYDLKNNRNVEAVMRLELVEGHPYRFDYYKQAFTEIGSFDEVYQLAADMGGAGYIFTGENDANVMHNSATINLNVVEWAVKYNVGRVFYSSSACMYPEHNQLDPNNPNCEESSAYPANPDSEYGWEKLFSERLYLAFNRNHNLKVRIGRYHNIYGPYCTFYGGKEKSVAAFCRKVAETPDGGEIEVWGDGKQTRSFLYIDTCIDKTIMFMRQEDFSGPVNIGSDEMVSINELASMAIKVSGKNITIRNIDGQDFIDKYGFKCPMGVRGRNSDNKLFKEKMGSDPISGLEWGIEKTYKWIYSNVL
jgi:nucleoside-diphosphate-sugar epimerase